MRFGTHHVTTQHEREQRQAHGDQHDELRAGDLRPHVLGHALRERRVDDQHDDAAVDELERRVVGLDEAAVQRCDSWPRTNGSRSCTTMSPIWPRPTRPLAPAITRTTRAGRHEHPSRFEAEALTIAPGTLPRAIEVNAIDDWTVDGTRQR
jgi:hypothetical protein